MTSNALNVKIYGESVLGKKTAKVDSITDEIKELAARMIQSMYEHNGIGLAAPQVGVNKKLIVVNANPAYLQNNTDFSPGEALLLPQMPIALVNPEIISFGSETVVMEEGCLSIPGIYAPVTRPTIITLKAQMLSGEEINVDCGGFLARILQHEIDHLDGVLFVDRIRVRDLKKIRKKLDNLRERNG